MTDNETVKTGCVFPARNDDCGGGDDNEMASMLKMPSRSNRLSYIWIQDVRNDVGILKAVRQRRSNTGMECYAE